MATPSSHNKNSSAVKRIMSEARELQNDDSTEYSAGPLEQDIFEWHCTIRGPADTEFEGGLYHCRIILPSEYPFKAPSIMVLTPNGRFELNKKICISFTSYHEELWQPAWGVRTAIIGLQGFFPLKGEAAVGVGAVEYPTAERKRLAALSRSWTCPDCGMPNIELLPDPPVKDTSRTVSTQVITTDNAVAPSHASLGHASIPSTIPPSADKPVEPSSSPSLTELHPPSQFMDPIPNVVLSPILPILTAPKTSGATPPQLREAMEEAESSTPRARSALPSESRTPTPRPSPRPSEQPTPPSAATTMTRSMTKSRPPIWLDGAIAFFCLLIAYVAGRRVSHLWELVTEHV